MKIHAIYLLIIAALVTALGWTCTVYKERAAAWESAQAKLHTDLAAAHETASRWHLTATALQGTSYAQSALAEACLQREAAALDDAAQREGILLLGPPMPISPEQVTTGVSDATRRAAADYLNRRL